MFKNYKIVFSHKAFRNLWLTQMLTGFGNSLYFISLSWIVWDLTNSTLQSGLFAIMYDSPQLILGLWIGIIIRRYNLRDILVFSDFLRACIVIMVLVSYVLGVLTISMIFIAIFLEGVLIVLNRPANNAIIPQVVSKDYLETANATTQMSNRIVNVTGYSIGGLLLSIIGAAFNILFNAISLIISIFLLKKIRGIQTPLKKKNGLQNDFKEGFHYLKSNRALVIIFSIGILMNVGGAPITVLGPAYAENILEAGARGYGNIQASWFIGIAVGAFYIGNKKIKSLWKALAVGFLLQGIAQIAFGLSFSIYVSMLLIAIHGISMSVANIPLFSFVQRNVPGTHLPHVFSILGTLVSIVNPLAFGVSGLLAENIGIRYTYILGGLLPFLATILIVFPPWLKNPDTSQKVAVS